MAICFVAFLGLLLIATRFSEGGECNADEQMRYVSCFGNFSTENGLKQEVEAIESPFFLFHLQDAQMDALPPDIFSNHASARTVDQVVFDRVIIKVFHVPLLGKAPFFSLRNNLKKFEIYDSEGLFAWDWSSFSELRELRTLIIENCRLYSVSATLGTAPNLRLVDLRNAEIYHIDEFLFHSTPRLTFFSVPGNHLKFLKRSWFPEKAEYLWSIDLSHNRLESLPDDAFTNMPSLHELKIDHNNLKKIFESVLAPVWLNLTELWLQGNELECESLCWAKSNSLMFFSDAFCHEGRRKTSKQLLLTYLEKCK